MNGEQKDTKASKQMSGMQRTLTRLLGVVVVVTIFIIVFGWGTTKVTISALENGGITLTDPGGGEHSIVYAEVTAVQLVDMPADFGICIDGGNDKGFHYGTWENEQWGRYSLCVKDSISNVILVKQNSGVTLFNYEGVTPTESFYEALVNSVG